jgi:hypothetical protein
MARSTHGRAEGRSPSALFFIPQEWGTEGVEDGVYATGRPGQVPNLTLTQRYGVRSGFRSGFPLSRESHIEEWGERGKEVVMSKVTVLGGCGVVGSIAVETLVTSRVYSGVAIADARIDQARKMAAKWGLPKSAAVELDAEDSGSLRKAVAGSSLVLNCVAPFYRHAAFTCQEE